MKRVLVAVALAALVAGCAGTGHPAVTDSSAGASITPSATSSVGTSHRPAPRIVVGGPGPLQLRVVVLASDAAAQASGSQPHAPASWAARFESYRCNHGSVRDLTSYVLACDSLKTKYLLAPATWSGRAQSANAGIPQGQAHWVVNISLDSDGTAAFTKLSRRLLESGGRVAVLVGTDVLAASRFTGVITDGQMQITGGFTEASAKALAHRLTGR
ncbi:MAG TPA: hypothetical protein VHZ06_02945 [Marmoricola sp.]|jgi:preprotein translocase subunit SecD|nr:hypothetical protein [Marmoricola sp.]